MKTKRQQEFEFLDCGDGRLWLANHYFCERCEAAWVLRPRVVDYWGRGLCFVKGSFNVVRKRCPKCGSGRVRFVVKECDVK